MKKRIKRRKEAKVDQKRHKWTKGPKIEVKWPRTHLLFQTCKIILSVEKLFLTWVEDDGGLVEARFPFPVAEDQAQRWKRSRTGGHRGLFPDVLMAFGHVAPSRDVGDVFAGERNGRFLTRRRRRR